MFRHDVGRSLTKLHNDDDVLARVPAPGAQPAAAVATSRLGAHEGPQCTAEAAGPRKAKAFIAPSSCRPHHRRLPHHQPSCRGGASAPPCPPSLPARSAAPPLTLPRRRRLLLRTPRHHPPPPTPPPPPLLPRRRRRLPASSCARGPFCSRSVLLRLLRLCPLAAQAHPEAAPTAPSPPSAPPSSVRRALESPPDEPGNATSKHSVRRGGVTLAATHTDIVSSRAHRVTGRAESAKILQGAGAAPFFHRNVVVLHNAGEPGAVRN